MYQYDPQCTDSALILRNLQPMIYWRTRLTNGPSMSINNPVSHEFQLQNDLMYLNHAAVAPWPARTTRAICQFAEENCHQGAADYPAWVKTETRLRERLAALINAPSSDDIALLKNTSEALSVVAFGLDWQPGENVVLCNQEFPSNLIVWQSLQRQGVEVRVVDISSSPDPEQVLIDAIDKKTKLLTSSSVQYASGLRMDLLRLGEYCHQHGILFCVDAIQSLGALQFDVQAIHADFVMADGHKWMLGPEGVALFYCRRSMRDRLTLYQYGWHMLDSYGDFDVTDWKPAQSARRFECGSPNMLGIHGLNASLSLLEEIGMDKVEASLLERTRWLSEAVQSSANLVLISNPEPARQSGIVVFQHRHRETGALYATLMEKRVICAQRGGGIRFSPHFYTEITDIEAALEIASN